MTAVSPFTTSVVFSGVGISSPLGPSTVTICQKEYAHDTATMTYWGGDVTADALNSGMPMFLTWGRPSSQRSFYGYVNHPQRQSTSLAVSSLTDRNATSVTCVGASFPMKQTDTKVFTNMTCSQIVTQIAAQFGFAASIVPDMTVWPSQQMGGQSYWQFCVGLAQQIGYTFYVSGVQLVFKPRTTTGANLKALAAIYDYSKVGTQQLANFNPVLGTMSPTGGQLATRQQAGVNPRTMQVVYSSVTGSPSPSVLGTQAETPPFNVTEHCTVTTQSECDAKTAGTGALNQMYIQATATTTGNISLTQGSLIYVANANGSQNGLWYIEEATHQITPNNYTVSLTLGRDSVGPSNNVSPAVITALPPSGVLTNNLWLAA